MKFDLYTLQEGEVCELLNFLALARDSYPKDFNKLVKDLDRTADNGLISNPERFRATTEEIWELVTYEGIHVLCFFDGDRIFILTCGFKKTKKSSQHVQLAVNLKVKYFAAKASNSLDYRDESYE